uniref:IgGFc_binding domain-containing protein n=1 Tax=Mesocestoides corti TaxID=53468 RepID=A0A5K3FU86_MESCO
MTEMKRHDIQRVQGMMESCLSKSPCTSRTTQFYVASDGHPQYNITITYLQSTSAPNRNILHSFRLSANVLDLNVTTCVEYKNIISTHHTYGLIRLSDVVLQADVILTDSGRLRFSNSVLRYSNTILYPIGSDEIYLLSVMDKLNMFFTEQC